MRKYFAVGMIAPVFAALVIFVSSASASHLTPPPDANSSCASAEYAGASAGHFADDSASSLVVVAGDKTRQLNTSTQVAMGREVTVCVMGLYNWIYVQRNDPAKLRLSIGGQVLSKMSLSTLAPPGQEYVNFALRMDPDDSEDQKAWAEIVYSFRHSPRHTLTISIAEGTQVFESHAVTTIQTRPAYWFYLVILFICLLLALAYLARTTPLLRSTFGVNGNSALSTPFSLGLVQMAFWFFVALAGYVYVCASTLQIHVPMGSMLGLLGISASTGLAAAAVDVRKMGQAQANAAGAPQLAAASKGFILDILSDADGISFHRFQIVVWTIVIGAVSAWNIYRYMAMPVLDASLLTLMGISSGTYVGFKFPEASK
jgi:hypothetical protein